MHGHLHPALPSNTVLPNRGEIVYRVVNRNVNRFSGKTEVEDVRCEAGTQQQFPGCLRSVHRPIVVVYLITGHALHTTENVDMGSQSVRHCQAPLVQAGLSKRHWSPAPGPHLGQLFSPGRTHEEVCVPVGSSIPTFLLFSLSRPVCQSIHKHQRPAM